MTSPIKTAAESAEAARHPFLELVDLAAERLGGAVIYANDDFFAEKENLLKSETPIFVEGKYTDRGKWMDGWESRRRRVPGNDFALVRLGMAGVVRGVVIDTAHFKGNYPDHASIQGCAASANATVEELLDPKTDWVPLLSKSKLKGDSKNYFEIPRGDAAMRVTHLRFQIYPDGGVARLRVHGDIVPAMRWMGRGGAEVDLAAAEHGGLVAGCNDMFFGSRHNLIMPGRSTNMGDGWETKRSRREGPDWVLVELAAEGFVDRAEIDTNYFKGNFPESAALHGIVAEPGESVEALLAEEARWHELLPRTKLMAHTRHFYESELLVRGPFTHVRMRIWPDGGVSRLRLHGQVTRRGRERQALRYLSVAPRAELDTILTSFCGSAVWVRGVADARPFASVAALKETAAKVWRGLGREDLLEAFRAHPRIGEKKAAAAQSHTAAAWSSGEQAKVAEADQATLAALAEANRAYEAKFGHIYIVCATGKTADEMRAIAEARLTHDASTELERAADEQRKIFELRIDKWITPA